MNILKKIMCWNSQLTNTENVLLVCKRIFTYIFPSGLLVWNLIIDKLIDNKVSVTAKIGCGGLFLLIALILVAVIMLGRHFKKTIESINEKLLDCTDAEEKEKLVEKKEKKLKNGKKFIIMLA